MEEQNSQNYFTAQLNSVLEDQSHDQIKRKVHSADQFLQKQEKKEKEMESKNQQRISSSESEQSFLENSSDQSDKQSHHKTSPSFLDEEEVLDDPSEQQSNDVDQLQSLKDLQEEQQNEINAKETEKSKKKLKFKDYQLTLFKNSRDKNSIIYLPTGTGKTMISIISMFYYLSKEGKQKKIIFLANTIQLVKQQSDAIRKILGSIIEDKQLSQEIRRSLDGRYAELNWDKDTIKGEIACIHGQKNDQIGMTKRKKIQNTMLSKKQFLNKIEKSTVIVMIAQMFLNCLRRGYINLTDFSFVVFDQCHHATGDRAFVSHPYASIMNQFYFNIKKQIQKDEKSHSDVNKRLPIIMGLTASPIAQPQKDPNKLWKKVQQLRDALDANYAYYPKGENLKSQTNINIMKVEQNQSKQMHPYLIKHFQIHRDHRQSLQKLKKYFPLYHKCAEQIINLLASKHKELALDYDKKGIHQVQIMVFYDLKECLLVKLRDLWLQLGEYAFFLGFKDLIAQLNQINLKKKQFQQLLQQAFDIFKVYTHHFVQKYDKCEPEFFSGKLNKLIELLSQEQFIKNKNLSSIEQPQDMVLIFAFKRRTVKYLQKVLNKYREQLPQQKRRFYQCVGVTGYSSQNVRTKTGDVQKTASDPTQDDQHLISQIEKYYEGMIEEMNVNGKQMKGESDKLTSQMKKMTNQKHGKLLLQVEQKYSKQIKKIQQFKQKRYRSLITTSVTEQGFDIPGCNTVISFDTPSSMKSYIQIKGRARKKLSKYYIFTNKQNYKQTLEEKQIYDATINATHNIAIDKLAKQTTRQKPQFKHEDGYKFVKCKGTGAIVNTNYALQLLKSFLSTLKQPNKALYYIVSTPNTCYKCIIKFPQTCPTSVPYVKGQPHRKKSRAIKSAAYRAVIHLYKQGYIKNDLRPRKYQELEEERQIQKYQDIRTARQDPQFMDILVKYSQIQIQSEKNIPDQQHIRKFMRFYYKPIQGYELDFPLFNLDFKQNLNHFEKQKFPFQMYMLQFSGLEKIAHFNEKQEDNQIGMITCFPKQYTNQIFEGYQYNFEQASNQKFSFKLIQESLYLTKAQYQKLKKIHNFLVAGCQNRQLQHYSNLTQTEAFIPGWLTMIKKKNSYAIDENRQFYPILTVLKRVNKNANKKEFQIDQNCNNHILQHQKVFKALFIYHNRKQKIYRDKFQVSLSETFKQFLNNLQNREKYTLVQSITKNFCFHKCLIAKRENISQEIQQKSKTKKSSLAMRLKTMENQFDHIQKIKNSQVVNIQLWRKYEKQVRNQYFKRNTSLKISNEDSSNYYFLKQFLQYPVTAQTLFKVALASKYSFKALYEYQLAFHFRNYFLPQLFEKSVNFLKNSKPFTYTPYQNIILENPRIFQELAQHGRSKHLRNIGQACKKGSLFIPPQISFSNESSINMSKQLNSNYQDSSLSIFFPNNIINQNSDFQIDDKINDSIIKRENLSVLRIPQVLKVLTSRIYKSGISDNYEQFQFIGDVVLKMLSTIQVFLKKPDADQGSMHIIRANIICNANLHRKAIKHKIFRYILTSKLDQPPGPCKVNYDPLDVKNFYQETQIQLVNQNTEAQGFQYIPGKVHADVIEALIGIFYLSTKNLEDCQSLLFSFGVLQKPNLSFNFIKQKRPIYQLPLLFSQFEQRIQYQFQDKGLLIQLFTDSSFRSIIQNVVDQQSLNKLISKTEKSDHNKFDFMSQNQDLAPKSKVVKSETFYERLQFLGDSILDLIVVEFLHNKYRNIDQGTLTLLKQLGVSNKALGLIALFYGMHEMILMDHAQNDQTLKQFNRIKGQFTLYAGSPTELLKLKVHALKLLGDVFQALVGAIFVDCQMKYQKTKEIVMRLAGSFFYQFTQMENLKSCPGYKFHQYLEKNNYKNYKIKKDTYSQPKNGLFKYLLIDSKDQIIQQCYEISQKRAWDLMEEQFMKNISDNKNEDKISNVLNNMTMEMEENDQQNRQ